MLNRRIPMPPNPAKPYRLNRHESKPLTSSLCVVVRFLFSGFLLSLAMRSFLCFGVALVSALILAIAVQDASAWSCCRVCPQHHLLEIDQLFGSTPPPVRRYDEPSFLELAAEFAARQDLSLGSNCCNICPVSEKPWSGVLCLNI
jgi:hypothetical protein